LLIALIVFAALIYPLTLFPSFIAPILINLNYIVDNSWLSFSSSTLNSQPFSGEAQNAREFI
jgi:hypothetical protein